ncbi:MAG: transglutaminase family protein [Sphaerospermopsis sp. SIO1G2]|nr:transglutaminase family protein [Sphaerospermopsis sp. SIO1G2]
MAIRVALHHQTSYRYGQSIGVGPQIIRLRPGVHTRTPIHSYSLHIQPSAHFINWQQDPQGNLLARVVIPEPTDHLSITVDLVVDLVVYNPFDFFIEEAAQTWPFSYDLDLTKELKPYLNCKPDEGPEFEQWLAAIDRDSRTTIDFLVTINSTVQACIDYTIRMEPGIQTPNETLALGTGSCRDSAWLLVTALRRLGIAARFVSGYLIQLTPDKEAVDGPNGATEDFCDLHAWCEAYIPGAGWVGLDPTSGLLAGEGHIPLACSPLPSSAAPISGSHETCDDVIFHHDMSVQRIIDAGRAGKPYQDSQWQAILEAGDKVDQRLIAGDVRLTVGGEPTFVASRDPDADEWNTAALGPTKAGLGDRLLRRLISEWGPGAVLHHGQGK